MAVGARRDGPTLDLVSTSPVALKTGAIGPGFLSTPHRF